MENAKDSMYEEYVRGAIRTNRSHRFVEFRVHWLWRLECGQEFLGDSSWMAAFGSH
jgi:hypothetical protein